MQKVWLGKTSLRRGRDRHYNLVTGVCPGNMNSTVRSEWKKQGQEAGGTGEGAKVGSAFSGEASVCGVWGAQTAGGSSCPGSFRI